MNNRNYIQSIIAYNIKNKTDGPKSMAQFDALSREEQLKLLAGFAPIASYEKGVNGKPGKLSLNLAALLNESNQNAPVVSHELMHWLEDMGVIDEKHLRQIAELTGREYQSLEGLTGQALVDAQLANSEMAAYAYQQWAEGKLKQEPPSRLERLFKRIRRWLENLVGMDRADLDALFESIDEGAIFRARPLYHGKEKGSAGESGLSSRMPVAEPSSDQSIDQKDGDVKQKDGDQAMFAVARNPYRDADGRLKVEPSERKLSAELQASQQRMIDKLNGPVEQVDAEYDKLEDARGGKVIGTDIYRLMNDDYAKSREGRIKYMYATSRPASAAAKDRLHREIVNRGDRQLLLFTAGGVAAGKSSSLGDAVIDAADLVFDGTMRNAKRTIDTINLALRHGWEVHVNYVHRPFDLVVPYAIKRASKEGRWGPLDELPSIHRDAQASFDRVVGHFAGDDRVQFKAYLNTWTEEKHTKSLPISLKTLAEGGKYRYTESDEAGHFQIIEQAVAAARQNPKLDQEVVDLVATRSDSSRDARRPERQSGQDNGVKFAVAARDADDARFDRFIEAIEKRRTNIKQRIMELIDPDRGGAVVYRREIAYNGQPIKKILAFSRETGPDRIDNPWRVTWFDNVHPTGKITPSKSPWMNCKQCFT